MAIKLAQRDFERAAHNMYQLKTDGTWHYKIGTYNGKEVAIVIGWSDAYNKGDAKYQIEQFGNVWTLCAKIAINIDDLQCDYDYDWYMPQYADGDVYDTDSTITDGTLAYLKDEAETVLAMLASGELTLEQ